MKKTLLIIALSVVVLALNAKPRTAQEMRNAAIKALTKSNRGNAAPHQGELKELRKMGGLTIFGYETKGFAVIANDDLLPEVLGVSDSQYSNGTNENFMWWLRAINEVCETTMAKGAVNAGSNVPTPEALGFEPFVDPIVSAEWDQDTPYWNMCPKKNGSLALTGCVATALAQVLYTHKTPVVGSGRRTNTSWSSITFDYDGYEPDYENMIDQYTSGPYAGQYTQAQADAVAKLMLACGVASNMDYSSQGSGAYTNEAAEGLIQYMGITTADFKEREYYSDTEWMTMIYEELSGGHAMYYSGVDYSGWQAAGHAFVCDGYDENGKVHINWGWSGSDNGLFNINLLNPVGYSFSSYQDVIMGLWDPNGSSQEQIEYVDLKITTEAPGQVAELISTDNFEALRSIVVTGEINNDDIAILRRLATGEELTDYDMEGKSHLATIDLTNAILSDNTIPDEAFKGCAILRTIRLPRHLAQIGSYAFANCSRLSSIRSYTFEVPKTGTRCFEGVNSNNVRVSVIAGASEYYRRNAQWKTICGTDNMSEFGTTLKAKSYNRLYEEANPVFGFQIYGERVVGTPKIWTEATTESMPGKYPIYIEAGSIENTENVVFVNGTLTIKDNPASGINDVNADESESVDYNIAGQRAASNSKGIIIQNGRKVLR